VSYLRFDIACRALFALDIRKRNIVSEALAWAGAPLETGDEALDKAVVFQGDDVAAIRRWAANPMFASKYSRYLKHMAQPR